MITSFLSAKGGTGLTSALVNIAAATASELQRKVLICDLNVGRGAIEYPFGVEDQAVWNIVDIFEAGCKIGDALLRIPEYGELYLLSASRSRNLSAVTKAVPQRRSASRLCRLAPMRRRSSPPSYLQMIIIPALRLFNLLYVSKGSAGGSRSGGKRFSGRKQDVFSRTASFAQRAKKTRFFKAHFSGENPTICEEYYSDT